VGIGYSITQGQSGAQIVLVTLMHGSKVFIMLFLAFSSLHHPKLQLPCGHLQPSEWVRVNSLLNSSQNYQHISERLTKIHYAR
jgi:hypothetical protein